MNVRREGRIMRIGHTGDETYNQILQTAANVGSQVRRMHDHEASLEDLFLVIMERLGHEVKSSDDLLGGV
jgi:aspartate aminotransferase-like enzyme